MLDLLFFSAIALQIIPVNSTTPCFLNETAGPQLWENCGYGDDWLQAILLPWQWITGGNFSLAIASILILFSYIKYQKVVYPLLIGTLFLPISYFLFPETFINFAIIMSGFAIGFLLWYAFLRQTKEYAG